MSITDWVFAQQKAEQTLWHLIIVDNITNKGIAAVTVSLNKTKYFSSNIAGIIDIDKTLIKKNDSVYFTCIGYKPQVIILDPNNKFPDSIRLSPLIMSLKEVTIKSPQETILGDIKKDYNSHRIPNPNEEFAQFISNKAKIKGTITSIEYVLHDELHGIEKPFRVRLYSKSKDSLFPDQELIKDSIVIYNSKRKHLVSVDISKYNIQFPDDGVIAIFETLPPSYYGKDSIWYNGRGHLKMPGIDMDLLKKDEYPVDYDKLDRKSDYSMVGPVVDQFTFDDVWHQWYVFTDGNNFAITLTIRKEY